MSLSAYTVPVSWTTGDTGPLSLFVRLYTILSDPYDNRPVHIFLTGLIAAVPLTDSRAMPPGFQKTDKSRDL